MSRILAVDDEPAIQRVIERLLRGHGHTVTTVDSGEAALAQVVTERPDVVLLDVQMPGMGGLEALTRLGQVAPGLPVIIMTAQSDIDVAVRAFKQGAVDFVVKPFVEAKLLGALDAVAASRRDTGSKAPTGLVGESPAFRRVMDLAVRLARPDINILLAGETGTGKELFARTIHASSKRHAGPFVPVDCSMLAETLIESELFGHEKGAFTGAVATRIGHFERADGGTLFLDEVGNLSLHVQAKLLRVLQEHTIERVGGRETKHLDVRVVSAANVDLTDAIARGTFRMDLYYRLAETVISPPPLRAREGDVKRLAEHFLERYARRFDAAVTRISPAAQAQLDAYAWPGNVRELEAVIKVAVALADGVVLPEHLPRSITEPRRGSGTPSAPAASERPSSSPSLTSATPSSGRERFCVEIDLDTESAGMDLKALTNAAGEQAERAILEAMLRQGHSQAQLAKLMNIDPKTLRSKLRKYGLDAEPRSG